jgi:hypothetical protein
MDKTIVTALALLAAPIALATPSTASASPLRGESGAYEVSVLVDGMPAHSYYQNGETYVLGQRGARYTLRVSNHSGQRVEAVVSVDGRDVIDGRTADYQHKRGYLVPAYGQVDIDGWRLSENQAAAFRFSSVAGSYAARMGGGREVGVIGVAVFPERFETPYHLYIPTPQPRPYYYGPRGEDKDSDAPPPPAAKADGRGAAEEQSRAATAAPSHSTPPSDAAGALARREKSPMPRPGLGTGFGERVDSPSQEVPFIRQNPGQPAALLGLRYNDRSGLYAMGIDVDGDGRYYEDEANRRRTANPFPENLRRYSAPPPGWDQDGN